MAGNDSSYLSTVRQMRLQIHMHIHIRILNCTNRLNMIQTKALGHLTEVLRWHSFQKPRHHLLNGSSLLLRQFVNHCRLGDALNVKIVRCLPGARVILARVVDVWLGLGLGGMRSMEVWLIAETAGGDGTHHYLRTALLLMTVLLEGTDDESLGSNGNAGRTGLARRDGRQTKNHCCRVGEEMMMICGRIRKNQVSRV